MIIDIGKCELCS